MTGSTLDPTKTDLNYHHADTVAAHGHTEHHDFRVLGVIVFLIAEGMIFLGLFTAYLTFRAVALPGPQRERQNLNCCCRELTPSFWFPAVL